MGKCKAVPYVRCAYVRVRLKTVNVTIILYGTNNDYCSNTIFFNFELHGKFSKARNRIFSHPEIAVRIRKFEIETPGRM